VVDPVDTDVKITSKLQDFIDCGGDMTRPRLFLKDNIRKASEKSGNLVCLFFNSANPPKTNWFRSTNASFIRIANTLMTSIILTGQISEKNEWVHCIVSYYAVKPIQASGTIIFLDDTELEELDNAGEEIIVQVGWLHHLDAFMLVTSLETQLFPVEF